MNKAELAAVVAEKIGAKKKDSRVIVDAVIDSIEEALAKGEKVQLVGFGTFKIRHRNARQGMSPSKPGETIEIAAANVPVFRAGKALKDAVNQ